MVQQKQKNYNHLTAQGAAFASHVEDPADRQFILSAVNEVPSRVPELIADNRRQMLYTA